MNKRKRTWVAAGICLGIAGAMLSGCNSSRTPNGDEGKTAGAADQKTGQTTIRYGYWGKRQEEMLKTLVARFEAENPDIKIEMELTPNADYWTKLEEAAGGGTAPDVFWMNASRFEVYAENDMLLSLEDLEVDFDGYPQTLVELYTYEGKKYGVPKDFDTVAVWYNKELFDNAGVPYPTADWTWEDMVVKAKALTDRDQGIYGTVVALDPQSNFYNTIYANGGYIISDDKKTNGFGQPEAVEAIECWVDLIDQGLSPTLAQLQDTDENTMFESGKVAMIWAGSYMTGEFMGNDLVKGKLDLVAVPSFNGKKGNVINGLSHVVYKKSSHPEEAKRFAAWLGSKEAMDLQGEQGVVISAYTSSQDLFAQAAPDMNLGVYKEMAEIAKPYPSDKYFSKWNDSLIQNIKKAYSGDVTVKEACDQISSDIDSILAGK